MKRISFFSAMAFALLSAVTNSSKAQEVKIYGVEAPPANYTAEGRFTGTTTDIVEELERAIGVTTPIEVVPVARAMEYVSNNPNVMVFSFANSSERQKAGFHFIGPVLTRAHSLWKKKGAPISVSSLADAKAQNLTVGAVLGDWRSKFLTDAGVAVSEVATEEISLKKLMAGRIPLMVSSNFDMPVGAKIAGVDLADLEPAYTISEASSYLMFSKDTDPATLEKWRQAYSALEKSNFFAKLTDRWGPTLGVPLKFNPGKGLYIP